MGIFQPNSPDRSSNLLPSSNFQRMRQVRSEVIEVLDADRKAQQPVGKSHTHADLTRYRGVGHRGRMTDQALDPTQALGAREESEAIEHAAPLVERAVTWNEGNHSSEPGGLAPRQVVLRMVRQAGIHHAGNAGVLGEEG